MFRISRAEDNPRNCWRTAILFSLLLHFVLAVSLLLRPGDISDPPEWRLVYCLTPRGCVAVWVRVSPVREQGLPANVLNARQRWSYAFPPKP